jgi:hypothetical protein
METGLSVVRLPVAGLCLRSVWYGGADPIRLGVVAEGQQVSGARMAEGIVSITASGLSIGPGEARPIPTCRPGRS